MALNLIGMFMRWLRQIFRGGSRKELSGSGLREREQVLVTPHPEETSVRILTQKKEPTEISKHEEPKEASIETPPLEEPTDIPEAKEETSGPPLQEEKSVQMDQESDAEPAEATGKVMQPSKEEPPPILEPEGKSAEPIQIEGEVVIEEVEGGTEYEEPSIKIGVLEKKSEGIPEPEKKSTQDAEYGEVAGEKEDDGKLKKPYTKKAPTEERKEKRVKPPATERKPSIPEEREPIFLGDLQKIRRRLTKVREKTQRGQVAERETIDEET
jgi:hypothetical protein